MCLTRRSRIKWCGSWCPIVFLWKRERERELIALKKVLWLYVFCVAVPWVGIQSVIEAFPAHLLFADNKLSAYRN